MQNEQTTNTPQNQTPQKDGEKRKGSVKELFLFVLEVAIIVTIVKVFILMPYVVIGSSMEPNYYQYDYLLIDKISYRLSEPKRGDVVVVKYPVDPSYHFLKRIAKNFT